MTRRRAFLSRLAVAPAAWIGAPAWIGSLGVGRPALAGDYRALVVVFLNGGNDGHDCLVPTDAAFTDYQRARSSLAIDRSTLVPLAGATAGHTFGMHPALAPLAPLYEQRRLAWIANAGPLVQPVTARQILDRAAEAPPFLLSHSDQTSIQQGFDWNSANASGWAGRALEALPNALRHRLAACTFDTYRTLVQGRQQAVSGLADDVDATRYWGDVDIARPDRAWTRELRNLAAEQSPGAYATEYARTLEGLISDAATVLEAKAAGIEPTAHFGNSTLAPKLRTLAALLPGFKRLGYRRQVFLVMWGQFDTHANQRGTGRLAQDSQLQLLAQALSAFDATNRTSGTDLDVTTLVMSEFGRTLRPASGAGTDHAWGNHWWLMGGPVAGGQVVGTLPSLTLGGPDDVDTDRGGRFVPTLATDQVAATLARWLGVEDSRLDDIFPLLRNFPRRTLDLLIG